MTITRVLATACMIAISGAASASHFDGGTPLLCSIYQLFECDHPNACVAVTPGEIRGMSHFELDFRNKVLTPVGVDSAQRSPIESSDVVDNKLIIQGIEDGLEDERDGAGWTISIMDPEGTMVMAVAGDGFGVMGLGACVPKP